MEWLNIYLNVFKKSYAKFDGRATRKEFWVFTLFNGIVGFLLSTIDKIIGLSLYSAPAMMPDGTVENVVILGVLYTIYTLAALIPAIAITTRRLHDTDRSGWWQLLYLTIIGGIVVLIFLVLDGTIGKNRYGEDPKGRA